MQNPFVNWWKSRSISTRLLWTTGTTFFFIGSLLLYTTVQTASANYRKELREQIKDELSAFSPLLVEQALIGDYASIQQMLDVWVKRKDMMLTAWTDYNGKRVEARDNSTSTAPPAWFTWWVNIPPVEAEIPLILGGQSYGKLTMILTPEPKINLIWNTFINQLSIILGGFFIILSMTILLLRRSLQPLHTLAIGAVMSVLVPITRRATLSELRLTTIPRVSIHL